MDAAINGTQALVLFLTEQQGAEWRRLNHLLYAAGQDFNRAQKWIRRGARSRFGGAFLTLF
jgi:hypothetical protein